MSGGFECDGDGRYELVRDGIAVLCNTTPLAVDAGNPNPSIFHPPSSILHLPSRTYPTLLSYNPDTSASQPVLPFPSPSSSPSSFSFSSPHLPPPFPHPPFDLPLQLLPGPTLVPPLRLYLRGSGGGWVGVR